ncbi:olfactory receptor class A-like protein 4 [Ambystoma mexicanum]|uniref:olfactory receptor class A-like protein 4 n=1 Tax=Ambystoma mexicanum TaxID=8296 RepID=UPI0037E73219
MVVISILGNSLVLLAVTATSWESRSISGSDLILAHLAAINLLIVAFWNTLLFATQLGLEVLLSEACCRIFMFLWMLLRTMSAWATFCVSVFHYFNLRRTHPYFSRPGSSVWKVAKAIMATWILNFLYSTPAFVYSTCRTENTTFSLIFLSSTTTRPLLGCVWNFPTPHITLLYVSISMAIHEVLPILLMVATNLCTLHHLKHHTRAIGVGLSSPHEAAKRRATKVILGLVLLFLACWGSNLLAVNYCNFAHGDSASSLITLANFCGSLFLGLSPLVLLAGHSKLLQKLCSMISSCPCVIRN